MQSIAYVIGSNSTIIRSLQSELAEAKSTVEWLHATDSAP